MFRAFLAAINSFFPYCLSFAPRDSTVRGISRTSHLRHATVCCNVISIGFVYVSVSTHGLARLCVCASAYTLLRFNTKTDRYKLK